MPQQGLDAVLRELDYAGQQLLVRSLPVADALRFRATCRTAKVAVDDALSSVDVRLRAPSQGGTDRDTESAWWEDTFSPRVRSTLDAASRRPYCVKVRVEVVTACATNDGTTARFARPFLEAHASGLRLPHVKQLELYVAEPWMPQRFSGPAVVLTAELAQALSGLFPGLSSLVLEGPCWASPDLADIHLEELPGGGDEAMKQRVAAQDQEAQRAFAALSPAHLPQLRHVSAPVRVVRCRELGQLSALTSLHVDFHFNKCDGTDSWRLLKELQVEEFDQDDLDEWTGMFDNLQELTVSRAFVWPIDVFQTAAGRPKQLQRLSFVESHLTIESEVEDEVLEVRNVDLTLDWATQSLSFGGCNLLLYEPFVLINNFAPQPCSVVVTHIKIGEARALGPRAMADAIGLLAGLSGGPESPAGGIGSAPGGAAATKPHTICFGAISCDTESEDFALLLQLLRDVGPCEELQLAGIVDISLAALKQLKKEVPPERLPTRLGLRLKGSSEFGTPLLGAMDELGTMLSAWPQPVGGVFVDYSDSKAFFIPRVPIENRQPLSKHQAVNCRRKIRAALMASARLQRNLSHGSQQQRAEAAAAAGSGAAAVIPATRTSPGLWCAVAVRAHNGFRESGFGAFRHSLGYILDMLPSDIYLHAGLCQAHCCSSRNKVWLAATVGPGPDSMQLGCAHRVSFVRVGAGRVA